MADTANTTSAHLADAESAEACAKRWREEQVRRQHSDRKEQFEAYEEEKRRMAGLGEFVAQRRRGDELRIRQMRERREERRREIALAFNRMYFPELADEGEGTQAVEPPCKQLFSEVPRIQGERIVLDRIVDSDSDALCDLIENPLVQRYEPTYLFEKQRDDVHETILLLYGDLFQNKESLILAIRMKATGELASLAEFYGLREELYKVSIGYRLRECWWGRGLATEAARLMVGYLYGETDIQIITASTMIENEGSARVLEKADFIRTARGVEEDWGHPDPVIVDKWFC